MLAITALIVAGMIGSGALGEAEFTGSGKRVADDVNRALELLSAVATGVGIFATILGIIIVTNEYRHGTITPTFLVTPRRERVIGAKVAAGAVAGVAITVLIVLLTLAIAIPWLEARDESLGFDGDLALAILRLLATFVLSVMFGAAVGALIHSQIGAIVATFAWFLILEGLLSLVAGWLFADLDSDPIGPYLPGSLFGALSGAGEADWLDPPAALVLLLVYTAVILGIGTVVTLRRDAD